MNLEIDTILAVIGVLATIVIGYIGVRYTLKHRKRTEIIFLKNSSISLFKAIVKNLDDIEINFQGKKIDENLIVFKGTFFNNGNTDIDKLIVHKPLEIELPDDYHWVRHKLIDSSEGLEINTSTQDNKLVFNWDLFKEGEYFTFDSLVEHKTPQKQSNKDLGTDISKGLVRNMKINHRITNLRKINRENSIPRPMPVGVAIFFSIVFLALVTGTGYISFGQFFFPEYKVLNEVSLNSNNLFVEIDIKDKDEILLIDEKGKDIKRVSSSELQQAMGSDIKITKDSINYWALGFSGFVAIVYFIMWIVIMISEYRERRLYKKLKTVAERHDDLDFEERKQVGFKLFELRLK